MGSCLIDHPAVVAYCCRPPCSGCLLLQDTLHCNACCCRPTCNACCCRPTCNACCCRPSCNTMPVVADHPSILVCCCRPLCITFFLLLTTLQCLPVVADHPSMVSCCCRSPGNACLPLLQVTRQCNANIYICCCTRPFNY